MWCNTVAECPYTNTIRYGDSLFKATSINIKVRQNEVEQQQKKKKRKKITNEPEKKNKNHETRKKEAIEQKKNTVVQRKNIKKWSKRKCDKNEDKKTKCTHLTLAHFTFLLSMCVCCCCVFI